MRVRDVELLRSILQVSRTEFSRFLGVSEATVVRWESKRGTSQPKGLQAVLLRALADAVDCRSPAFAADVVRECTLNHRRALKVLLDACE